MGTIKGIKTLKGVGILTDKSAKDESPNFLRFNLLYGFNGSGKSTLSRIFASLEAGKRDEALPGDSSFEIEMDDGTSYTAPQKMTGLENRVCVFNADFIVRNLQWEVGRANSIFYISQELGELATELKAAKELEPVGIAAKEAQAKLVNAREKALKTYRTERAKIIAGALHSSNRRYEAGQLSGDYEKLAHGPASLLTANALEALIDIARLSAPPPTIKPIEIDVKSIQGLIESARKFGEVSIGQVVLEELEKHPSMVPWMKEGHDYHGENALATCLFCGNELTEARKTNLAAALDDKIATLLTDLGEARATAVNLSETLLGIADKWPKPLEFDPALQAEYTKALKQLTENFHGIRAHLKEAARVIVARLRKPTTTVPHTLPETPTFAAHCEALNASIVMTNSLIEQHNTAIGHFTKRQDEARVSIRKHFITEGSAVYTALRSACEKAVADAEKIEKDNGDLEQKIRILSTKVKTHGPAAEQINKLMRAYLGHSELTIMPAAEGYELHRHGRLVHGQPSDGEKTAIALCYFLSTLEAEGRSIKDLIVVIDDPISSLDTKAMNYACALVRSRLAEAAQIFVFTHNQHCMNEFKKAWRKMSTEAPPKASFLFMDVKVPIATGLRTSNIIELPKQLRAYDSEYHFLCHKLLQFEEVGEAYSEYWFMLPNVMRRVLEIFLAFKVPGSHPIEQKLDAIWKRFPDFDRVRITALERLSQVESHSDNLEDLIGHSSMTVEETRDANAALLALMAATDADHTNAIRAQCKSA
jgi:wobble nucleotide-excising tRNase